ncbi:phosphotransferase family protein [Sphingobium sp. EM0848]|uniref:phosphotransferase family protein n=1 Tax=Sphingobium sp. EM0848 TaxID=2743473 RepID=UPI00159CA0E1|nr:phosphotransferase family protein [Sphingobium sp. EM0848]
MSQTMTPTSCDTMEQALAGWLAARLDATSDVEVTLLNTPDANGFSNVTMLFDARWSDREGRHDRRFVVRVQPTGEGLFPTYDVSRQFEVMRVLEVSAVPVPRVRWLDTDSHIFGAPFFVMDYVDGHIPSDDPSFAAGGWILGLTPQQRQNLCDNALAALVGVHEVDWRTLGLDWLLKAGEGSSTERELAYYEEFYRWAAEGLRVPAIEAGLAWARDNMPLDGELVLSWGDSRIGNMIFNEDLGVRAVIDWEGASLASREKDLGHWLLLTHVYTVQFGLDLPEGFPDREALLSRYEELSGRPLGNVHFFEVMSGIHASIQAMRALSLMGKASDDGRNEAAILNNPFTRGLARLIGFEMSAAGGLDVLTGKR